MAAASGNNKSDNNNTAAAAKEETWLQGLEHRVENFVSGILHPTPQQAAAAGSKAIAVATTSLDLGAAAASSSTLMKGTLILRKRLLALDLTDLGTDGIDDIDDCIGSKVGVQLVSNTCVDPKTGEGLRSSEVKVANWAEIPDLPLDEDVSFSLNFDVPSDFGSVGAIIVHNGHTFEFLLVSFSLALPAGGDKSSSVVHFPCNSWVYNTTLKPGRIFFSNQVYLPAQTPAGLVSLRAEELGNLRGDGTGERHVKDRIYDYDVYNDLGNPNSSPALKRPTLGGSAELPYPRRCRTGRHPTKTDPSCESPPPASIIPWTYVPRDEVFAQYKTDDFLAAGARSVTQTVAPRALISLHSAFTHEMDWESLDDVFRLYAPKGVDQGVMKNLQPDTPKAVHDPLEFFHAFTMSGETTNTNSLQYPIPNIIAADKDAWSSNEEFAREFIAGLNPMVITRVTEFPMKSKLDPSQYGDPVSAITAKHVNRQLPDGWDVNKALAEKKLFVVDYHDTYLTYVNRINALLGSAFYASRTLMFLSSEGTLQVLAIELTLPPSAPGGAKNSRVFTPPDQYSTKNWVWELAKAHVMANDAAFHQVVNHFTRTHAAIEPMIIATNRQLSALHPINLVLVPHFKNTMDINAAARQALINANGIIEASFTPQKYCLELGAVVYKLDWRFDDQGLPADLVKRGMAIPDPNAKHGLKLLLEDYPYAVDGLDLWAAIETWYSDFVDIFYSSDSEVVGDVELQSWWTEIRTVGHGDKKDEPGWIELDSKRNLVRILVTVAWVASCHHAAVNFGQYEYAGFMPSHPTCMRKLIPEEHSPEWKQLQDHPQKFYLSSISTQTQTTVVMATIEILSTHAVDEEYLGQRLVLNWTNDDKILAAFGKYSNNITAIDHLIKERNTDKTLKNRSGPVQIAYELLRPTSGQGMTGRGVPNSVSI